MFTLTTQDPYTSAIITDASGDEIDRITFDFYSEDEVEWAGLADKALAEQGWKRAGQWSADGETVAVERV